MPFAVVATMLRAARPQKHAQDAIRQQVELKAKGATTHN